MREHPKTTESELSSEELECLTELLRKNSFAGDHLEIGTAAGGTLVKMLRCYAEHTRPHFVVIDLLTYFANQREVIIANLNAHGIDPDSVEFRVARSYDVFKQAEKMEEAYDFIFIDGAHKCKYVMQDLSWARLLRVGGLLCLHDYAPKTRGVMVAANRFMKKYVNYTRVALAGTLLVLRKGEAVTGREVDWIDHWYATMMTLVLQLRSSVEKRFGWSIN
jgi:predicted O-methyltransferase YrrM